MSYFLAIRYGVNCVRYLAETPSASSLLTSEIDSASSFETIEAADKFRDALPMGCGALTFRIVGDPDAEPDSCPHCGLSDSLTDPPESQEERFPGIVHCGRCDALIETADLVPAIVVDPIDVPISELPVWMTSDQFDAR